MKRQTRISSIGKDILMYFLILGLTTFLLKYMRMKQIKAVTSEAMFVLVMEVKNVMYFCREKCFKL